MSFDSEVIINIINKLWRAFPSSQRDTNKRGLTLGAQVGKLLGYANRYTSLPESVPRDDCKFLAGEILIHTFLVMKSMGFDVENIDIFDSYQKIVEFQRLWRR